MATASLVESASFRVVSYNIHQGRGLDGKRRIDRILEVLKEIDADIIALQEVFGSQASMLRDATQMHMMFGPTRSVSHGLFGNVCLSRFPFLGSKSYSLTCRPSEPRGCLRVDVDCLVGQLHIFNVHLGLGYLERIRQVRMLAGIIDRRVLAGPRLLLGDFNEWFHGRASRLLRAEFGHAFGRRWHGRTHPSPLPVFPLDRIYHDPIVRTERVTVHQSRLARVASDHLPVYTDVRLYSPESLPS